MGAACARVSAKQNLLRDTTYAVLPSLAGVLLDIHNILSTMLVLLHGSSQWRRQGLMVGEAHLVSEANIFNVK